MRPALLRSQLVPARILQNLSFGGNRHPRPLDAMPIVVEHSLDDVLILLVPDFPTGRAGVDD